MTEAQTCECCSDEVLSECECKPEGLAQLANAKTGNTNKVSVELKAIG
ncbi:MAG: hypothetical protein IJ834_05190 [Paludibacteraceae bacterium]|nr:hypothetical protein [Paludibacteraceae bacterium]